MNGRLLNLEEQGMPSWIILWASHSSVLNDCDSPHKQVNCAVHPVEPDTEVS